MAQESQMATTVLVIEDETDLLHMIVEYLGKRGYRATGCTTLMAARKALETSTHDAVLADIRLPDGDGVSFCLENAPRLPNARWILMSGDHELVRDGQRARDIASMPAFTIVDKPVPLRLLERILKQPLAK